VQDNTSFAGPNISSNIEDYSAIVISVRDKSLSGESETWFGLVEER
jgi:hypothetical protein